MKPLIRAVLLALLIVSPGCGAQGDPQPAGAGQTAPTNGEASGGVEALRSAGVLERLVERTPPAASSTGTAPAFVIDPAWPKPLPNNWIIGEIGGLFVDRNDRIWVYHRPRALDPTEAGALDASGKDAKGAAVSALGHPRPYGRASACCVPAPSILQFDKSGTLLQAWGGPGDPGFLENKCRQQDGCVWPAREHGIFVDHNDFVYVAGNGQAVNFYGQFPWAANFGNDSHVLKFTSDGTFVYQIGRAGAKGPNSNDTNGGINGTPQPYLPADMFVDPKTNYLYIADGYGNRRVLIVDAGTGKYVGHFGAYGQNPVPSETEGTNAAHLGETAGPWAAGFRRGDLKPKFFRSPLHCVKVTHDGLLYTCDRGNNRIQVFRAADVGKPCANPNGDAGKCGFVSEIPIAPQTVAGTVGTMTFSPDATQTCMYVADLSNNTIYEINRENAHELARIGTGGRQAGQFHWPHVVSADSEGSLYTGEVDAAGRVQKFIRYGANGCSGTGSQEIGKY
jgi:hypothetical protein